MTKLVTALEALFLIRRIYEQNVMIIKLCSYKYEFQILAVVNDHQVSIHLQVQLRFLITGKSG